jgi:hypothetical protein
MVYQLALTVNKDIGIYVFAGIKHVEFGDVNWDNCKVFIIGSVDPSNYH